MRELKIKDFQSISLTEYAEFLKGNRSIPKRSVLISFDDGYSDAIDNAVPIMEKYKYKGIFFVIGQMVKSERRGGYCSLADLKKLVVSGHDVQSHTWSHKDLAKIGHWSVWDKELGIVKMFLEGELGIRVHAICYPYGSINRKIISKIAEYNYDIGFTCKNGLNDASINPYLGCRDEVSISNPVKKILDFYQKNYPEWFN